MFIKNGDGKITDILKDEDLSDEQKKSVKEAVAGKDEKGTKQKDLNNVH